MKCPYCHYVNEEGVLFCEQCKSDLSVERAAPAAQPVAIVEAEPVAAAPELRGEVLAASLAAPEVFPVGDTLATNAPATLQDVDQVPASLDISAPPVEASSPVAPAVAPDVAVEPPTPDAAPAEGDPYVLAPDMRPRLVVTRGQKINEEFPLFEGENYIGRADDKPVDIDLDHQEHPDRMWSSRQHAVVIFGNSRLSIKDLNSSNGTFVNRSRILPDQECPLKPNDVIQIGTVQMKVRV